MVDTAKHRKARGAFFTPPEIARFLASWVVQSAGDRIFEPSCGEAAFLVAVGDRLAALGLAAVDETQLLGIDIHPRSVREAASLLSKKGFSAELTVGNFFDVKSSGDFDAVVGNPPYVRYQDFSGEDRAKAKRAALAQGVRLSGLASSWAAFVVHAASLLKPSGRLALVLPAELLSVNYAGRVRRFLLERFREVRLVLFEQRVFPGVMEEVVLLLAEGTGPTDHCDLYQASRLEDLNQLESRSWSPPSAEAKWLPALLPAELAELYESFVTRSCFSPLIDWGETDLGMVTGNNKFFSLTQTRIQELSLRKSELIRISPPSSRHLRGLNFSERAWSEMAQSDARAFLFYPKSTPSAAAKRYIREGEKRGVHKAYKCRVRSSWWRVPLVSVPDLFVTYMNHDTPRLVANTARVPYLNSVHGVTLRQGLRQLGSDLLPIAALNSVTLLGAELVGRSYGGGILKLEPKEADLLPVPSVAAVRSAARDLRLLRPQLARHLRNGELDEVVALVDRVLLIKSMKAKRSDIEALRTARALMFTRRTARGAKKL